MAAKKKTAKKPEPKVQEAPVVKKPAPPKTKRVWTGERWDIVEL